MSEAQEALSRHTCSCPASEEVCADEITPRLPDSEGNMRSVIHDFKNVWPGLSQDEQDKIASQNQEGQRLMADLYFAMEKERLEREERESLERSTNGSGSVATTTSGK